MRMHVMVLPSCHSRDLGRPAYALALTAARPRTGAARSHSRKGEARASIHCSAMALPFFCLTVVTGASCVKILTLVSLSNVMLSLASTFLLKALA